MECINVRIDQRLKHELETEASEKGMALEEFVRQALEEHVRQRTQASSCLDLARRIGFIGACKDVPPDLSANPAHMEGFGRA